ncbi:hypothetical protein [Sphingobacterium litopenaei]|uniref:DUF4843 domain-containing protein n=1 Tax=Sphingobacterium litopenaei TaxID=2763500 RepID=A0ABR7YC50_9SPHI|nr:hypothetical protein [Sphingobacterium litopenaei]MBD1428876.1 hypothetical protein [Sphingobacterium litopenaei]
MKRIINIICLSVLSLFITSCNKELITPYDNPFFYIHLNQASSVNIQSTRNETVDYNVYFSTKMQYDPITLKYDVIVGNGLQEGVDFELVSTTKELVFKPGYFEMPISIRWKSNPIDPAKDNTVTIKLISNDKNITIGLPGPDKNQSEFKIVKI